MATSLDYATTSPYGRTKIHGRFMGYYEHRNIPARADDFLMMITDQRYVNRPDNLAFDIYGNDNYWWVIPVRNALQDPIFDMKMGKVLIVPNPTYIRSAF